MSVERMTAAAAREPLAASILEYIERLEAVVEEWRRAKPSEPAEIRRALEPIAEQAEKVRAEYGLYRERLTPILERLAALDLDALENFRGFPHISAVPSAARRIGRTMAAAIEDLDGVVSQAEAFTRGERADVPLWEMRRTVAAYNAGLLELTKDVRFFLAAMKMFNSAQLRPV